MAIRNTKLVIKNSVIPSQTLPSSGVLQGEGLVNLGDGILFFSGGTSGSPTWVQSNNPTSGYFEVGSNLYQLKIRDKITEYSGVTNLSGKFLSGTTSGFVLADIANIAGSIDSYVTGATWNPNILTINLNNGKPSVPVTIDSFTALTINGNLDVTGTETVNNLTITGTGIYNTTATGSNPNEIVNYSSLTAFSQTNDVYVTGSTLSSATNNTDQQTSTLLYHGTPIGGPYTIVTENTYTTGGTYNSGTTSIDFSRNDGVTYSIDLSNIDVNDTFVTGGTVSYAGPDGTLTLTRNDNVNVTITGLTDVAVTGFSYNPSTNTFTITDNDGGSYPAQFTSVSGLSFSNLTQGRVVYVGAGGLLTDEAGFTYDENTDTLGVENIEASGDVTIQGSLTVFGPSVSAFTSNLYVEDPNITLNYNPTGSTTVTSVNAGLTIQDGNGISSGDVNFDIVRMQNLTGLTSNEVPSVSEYTGLTGYANRGFITQLNDIIIRSTDVTDGGSAGDINGVRVLAEFDVLDGGSY
jgi:phage baseplate assembly protein gpV